MGVIHRDVKPGNILVGNDGALKLTDFDLAHAPDTEGGTQPEPMGSYLYSSPEVLTDPRAADPRSFRAWTSSVGAWSSGDVLPRESRRKTWSTRSMALALGRTTRDGPGSPRRSPSSWPAPSMSRHTLGEGAKRGRRARCGTRFTAKNALAERTVESLKRLSTREALAETIAAAAAGPLPARHAARSGARYNGNSGAACARHRVDWSPRGTTLRWPPSSGTPAIGSLAVKVAVGGSNRGVEIDLPGCPSTRRSSLAGSVRRWVPRAQLRTKPASSLDERAAHRVRRRRACGVVRARRIPRLVHTR